MYVHIVILNYLKKWSSQCCVNVKEIKKIDFICGLPDFIHYYIILIYIYIYSTVTKYRWYECINIHHTVQWRGGSPGCLVVLVVF